MKYHHNSQTYAIILRREHLGFNLLAAPIYKEDRFSDNLFPIVSSLEIVYFVISLTSVTASSQPSIITAGE